MSPSQLQWFNTETFEHKKEFPYKHKWLPVRQWEQETPEGLWAPNLINSCIHTAKNESGVPVALVQKKHVLLRKKNVDITGIKTKIFRDKYNNCMRNIICVIFSFYEVPWKTDTNIITIFLIWYYTSIVVQIQFWHSTIEASS